MGIPHLITHLRPYSKNTELSGQCVIIDGPAFAYHVFHACLADEPDARNPFAAFPSYKRIGDAAIRWLDELEDFGVEVYWKKIYFDGFLPVSKSKTRSTRLTNNTTQMALYHEAWPQVIPSSNEQPPSKCRRTSMFDFGSSATVSKQVPAVPFLVPAVLEALLGSERYRNITAVLPGEADLYCSGHVKEHGGTVLTGDSDLLVHDLGTLGSVSFFKDLEVSKSSGVEMISCYQYTPDSILERLDLNSPHGLKALAFEMKIDPHASFPVLLKRSKDLKAITQYEGMYHDFKKEYEALSKGVDTAGSPQYSTENRLRTVLRTLDPRISEYVLHFQRAARAAELPFSILPQPVGKGNRVDMFLPFLLDCPSKTSAWEMSTAVRQLAYGVMNLSEPQENHITSVVEHRRLQKGSRGREWQLPTYAEIEEASATLVDLIEKLSDRTSDLPDFDIWRAIAFHQDLVYSSSTGKQSLGSLIIESGERLQRLSWETIHFSAQLQGSFYSFRILKQILNVAMVSQNTENLSLASRRLSELLHSLPDLRVSPSVYADLKSFRASMDSKAFFVVKTLLGIGSKDTTVNDGFLPSKKGKKKRKREQNLSTSADISKRSNNMFDLLDST